jgi:hypothetical protein
MTKRRISRRSPKVASSVQAFLVWRAWLEWNVMVDSPKWRLSVECPSLTSSCRMHSLLSTTSSVAAIPTVKVDRKILPILWLVCKKRKKRATFLFFLLCNHKTYHY